MKKIGLVALAAILACSSVACNTRGGGEKIDKNKTQLFVTTFEGGYGSEWLDAIKARFEAQYANVSFESGKTGVQVLIKDDRNLTNELLTQNLAGSNQEVFFTEAVNYYDLQERGLLYDISDAVTKPINYDFNSQTTVEGEETVSLESKMSNLHKEYYKADDGKYYGIPFYEANYGIVYDVDLFEKEGLYLAAPGEGNSMGFIKNEKTARSAGPDGKTGTADDGLPATYDEFFQLCDYMVEMGITPITWGGKTPHYVNVLVEALQADYEGEANMRLNYTFDGTATNLVESINADGTLNLYSETITPENGYLTWTKQAGRYYGLKFVERLTANSKYYVRKDVISPSFEHLEAQNAFLTGKFLSNKPTIAMLIDGSWWHNEAGPMFDAAAKEFTEAKAGEMARKFSFMPLPKATADKVGEGYTVMDVNSSICFVNGNLNPKKEALVKEFLQFCHTNQSLAEFTSMTYTCKPYTYTMTQEELNAMPYWGQELYRLHNEAHFISTYSKSPIYKANAGKFTEHFNAIMYQSKVGNSTHTVVPTAMLEDGVSAIEYFNGLSAHLTADRWTREFLNVGTEETE